MASNYSLCCGLGYTYNLKIYSGKEQSGARVTPENVVMFLTRNVLNAGRTLITDNWYSSIPLATKMVESNTHFIGTIRKNRRGLPKEVVNKKMKKGEVCAMENQDGLTVINWKDQRNVLMLSTRHGTEMKEVAYNRTTKLKPKVVVDYNKGKGSVDLSDQMGAYSNPLRKSLKWYRKVAFELLLTTSMVNAFILHKAATDSHISIVDFKKQVIKSLSTADGVEDQDVATQTKRHKKVHTLQKKEGGNKHKVRRVCKQCYKKNNETSGRKYATNRTKKVDTFCSTCEGAPFLCLPCFNDTHRHDQ